MYGLNRFYELLSEYNGFPSIEIESRVVSSLLSAFYLRQPQHPDFERWEDRALVLSQDCRDMYTKTQIFNKLLSSPYLFRKPCKSLAAA